MTTLAILALAPFIIPRLVSRVRWIARAIDDLCACNREREAERYCAIDRETAGAIGLAVKGKVTHFEKGL